MIYNKIVKYMNFPLYSLLSGKYKYYLDYKQLEKNQWLPEESLEELRWKLFTKLIKHVYENTAYYRQVIDKLGALPEDFTNPEALRALPVITKDDLQAKREQLRSQNLLTGSFVEDASGGSTGEPTIFYVHNYRYTLRTWEQIRHDRWSGWELGESMALLWGASHDLEFKKRLYGKLVNFFLYRQLPLDAFALTDEKMENFAKILMRKKPSMLLAYANAVYTFAQYLESSGFPAENMRLKGIVSSAEKTV